MSGMTIAITVAVVGLVTPTAIALANSPGKGNANANGIHKGLPDSAYHNSWAKRPDPPLPTAGPPGLCGPWSATDSPQVLAVSAVHGTLDSCQLIDHSWIVTTHTPGGAAQVAVLNCAASDKTCLNGWLTKDLSTFTWHAAPASVTQLRVVLRAGHVLTMLTNNGEWTYDFDHAAFAAVRSAATR